MKYSLLSTVFIFLFAVSSAKNSDELLNKLSRVNAEWRKQKDVEALLQNSNFNNKTFNDWIATHLMLVEKTLRLRDASNLSPYQKQNRVKLLDELNGYWKAGIFPVNDYLPYKNPVFIDRKGTHCAVGYLMMQSGRDDLAQLINSNEKFAYVHEIKTKNVTEWATESGFTLDELAWIQPAYPPTFPTYDLDGGLNGTVNTIVPDSSTQIIYVGGAFTQSTSGIACNNVGAWVSGFAGWDWIPLSGGLNGAVHALLLYNNKLYAGGEFTMAGATAANHIAVYDISLGLWQALGSLDSTVRALTFYNNELFAAGDFTGYLSKWNGSSWQDVAQGFLYYGGARTLEVWNNKLVVGGDFELATGALRKHVAVYDGIYMGNLSFGTITPVNDLEIFEGNLFAACDVISGTDTCAVAMYNGSFWEVKLKGATDMINYFEGKTVKALKTVGSQLIAAGHFDCGSGLTFGSNLMELSKVPQGFGGDTTQLMSIPLTMSDSTIKTFAAVNNTLYFGGDFITTMMDTTNHIAYMNFMATAIPVNNSSETSLNIFPNPASDFVCVEAVQKILHYELFDITGRKISEERISSLSKNISFTNFSSGVYFLHVLTENGWSSARVIKE